MLFWERFYSLCSERKVKPNTVCAELGYSSATSTHWKNGSIPKGDVLLTLADYFHCSVDYLLGREEIQKAVPAELGTDDEQKNRLISNYDKLNDKGQRKLAEYSDDLVDTKKYVKSNAGADKVGA